MATTSHPVKKTDRKKPPLRRVLLVTGISGAGHSTALKTLEDMGYKAIDNLPVSLLEPLLGEPQGLDTHVAIGIDSRAWDFSGDVLVKKLDRLRKIKGLSIRLLFIDCQDDVLQQRFTETRRVHPLAVDRPVSDGIALERVMMQSVRAAVDHVIDTSGLRPQDLRRILGGYFRLEEDPGLAVFITSFGFRNGLPREADLVFDVRFLDNPHWEPALRALSGRDAPVADKIRKDSGYKPFFKNLTTLLAPLLPRYEREGRHYLTIAVGCTGGRHRSVFTAEELGKWFHKQGVTVDVRHRDLAGWAARQNTAAADVTRTAAKTNTVKNTTKKRKKS